RHAPPDRLAGCAARRSSRLPAPADLESRAGDPAPAERVPRARWALHHAGAADRVMKLIETALPNAYVIEPEPVHDERGWFARIFDREAFGVDFPQHSLSFNAVSGTLRGMHYQAAPHEEAKIVRCIAGAIHDVIIDLRSRKTFAVELSAENRLALYVPPGCAHG